MGEIITSITEPFTSTISAITSGIREAFTSLIYETTGDGQVLSNFAKFGFTLLGFGFAISVIFFIVKLIRR